ncbi:hypothetical protein IJT10_01975 [bacterium]|nr:hypothetical protein [bacterium]
MAEYKILNCEYCDNVLTYREKFCSGCGKANPYYQLLPISDLDDDVAKKLVRENEKAKFAEHKARDLFIRVEQRVNRFEKIFKRIDSLEDNDDYFEVSRALLGNVGDKIKEFLRACPVIADEFNDEFEEVHEIVSNSESLVAKDIMAKVKALFYKCHDYIEKVTRITDKCNKWLEGISGDSEGAHKITFERNVLKWGKNSSFNSTTSKNGQPL